MVEYSKINYIDPKELKPYPQNTKKHPDEQLTKLVKLMENYGFPEGKAVIVDENLEIIHGHGRTLAAIAAELKSIPYQIATKISEADKRAFRIADNAVSESDWDYQVLKLEFGDLLVENFEMDLLSLDDIHLANIEAIELDSDIPEDNKDIEEDELKKTNHTCPECGFKW